MPAQRKELVDFLRICFRVSTRRARGVMVAVRSTLCERYRGVEPAALRKRIREVAETRVRYGYERIHVLLQREGWRINHKRVHRLCRKEGADLIVSLGESAFI